MDTLWIAKDADFLHVDNEDSDLTKWICIGRFEVLLDAQINSNWPSFSYVAAHTILSGKISNPIRSNLNSLNTDGSLTMANLNSFLGPFEILQIAEEKNFFKEIVLFYHETVCCLYSSESPH